MLTVRLLYEARTCWSSFFSARSVVWQSLHPDVQYFAMVKISDLENKIKRNSAPCPKTRTRKDREYRQNQDRRLWELEIEIKLTDFSRRQPTPFRGLASCE
jgi:hypothetical protein